MLKFHTGSVLGAVVGMQGVALPQLEGLKLVFQKPLDTDVNLLEVEAKEVLISWTQMISIECQRGMLKHRVTIKLQKPLHQPDIRWLNDEEIVLHVEKKHREDLTAFERAVAERRSGKGDESTDDFIDDMRDFLYDFD